MRSLLFLCSLLILAGSAALATDDYWQQEVNYRIEVKLQDDLRSVDGKIEIDYHNNSPDTLDVIYLKAWPNAVQRGSYSDRKGRRLNDYTLAGLKPAQEGSLELSELSQGDSFATEHSGHRSFSIDNSIIEVTLAEPLLPGRTVMLSFGFKTIFPTIGGLRMGLVRGVLRASYWYPQACVYDRVQGWNNAQYIGWGECYGDYGNFDVAITTPDKMIVAATGECVNEADVLYPSLREKLDIQNFVGPPGIWPSLEFDPNGRKTWHFVARNVNDFVFTTSARWCIDSDTLNGVEVVAYPLRTSAKRWLSAVELGKQAIETFSGLFIPYQWPVIRICDAYSGMEYPMVVNCGGGAPSTRFNMLIYHEIGHQWFMGQIGSNQVDRPFLDEGFTTHAEHVVMEKYLGRESNYSNFTNWYQRTFAPSDEDRNARGFRPLLLLMDQGYDKPMDFSYDRGEEYYPYRVSAYYKSAAMHYSLRSILGDSAYFDAMQLYCDRWLFKHPYEDDFQEAMEDATGLRLTEYFRQWYHGTEHLDYAYAGKRTRSAGDQYEHTIRLRNDGRFVSPIDVAVIWEQGDTTFFTVAPEGMAYTKPLHVPLPEWKQFRIDEPEYEYTITSRRKIAKVVVDPRELLMDVNRLNNVPKKALILPPIELRLDNLVYDRTPLNAYAMRWRPDIWYDTPNGMHLGLHSHGSFLERNNQHSLDFRMGLKSVRPILDFSFSTPADLFGHGTMGYRFLMSDYRRFLTTDYNVLFKPRWSRLDHQWLEASISFLSFDESDGDQDDRLDPLPSEFAEYVKGQAWDMTTVAYMTVSEGSLSSFRGGKVTFANRNYIGRYNEDGRVRGFLEEEFDFQIDFIHKEHRWLTVQSGLLSTVGTPPGQFLHHISRAPAMDAFLYAPVFRAPGTFPLDWQDGFYLGERRVRGYQDRALYITEAFSASIEVSPVPCPLAGVLSKVPVIGSWLSGIERHFFFDAASVSMEAKESFYPAPIASNETVPQGDDQEWFTSAGLSFQLPPIRGKDRLRIDFPVYLNRPGPGEDHWDFRFSVALLLEGAK